MNKINVVGNVGENLKNRYILIAIIGIIIIVLIIIFAVVANVNAKKKEKIAKEIEIQKELEKKEEIMRFVLESKQKEKEEEEKATGIIYLTFDDGPSADSTPQILDILAKNDIKATFFVLHYNEQNEHLIKREHEEGHKVALHGYTHNYSEIYTSADSCMENFRKIQEQVYNTTGEKSNIIRFPGGGSNTISKKYCEGVMTELTGRVVNEGFRYFDWNVDSDDAGRAKNSEDIYNNVTNGIKPGRSNVVLMHDFTKNDKTIGALDRIIAFGKENGYVFRKITDETPMVTHAVNN